MDLLSDSIGWTVASVVFALNLNNHSLHFLGLSLPLFIAHFGLLGEQLVVWLAVAATKAIPESGELAVVIVEVQVVHRVASGAVDDRAVSHVFTIVNHNGPNLDESEESDIGKLLEWEEENEEVVWHTLRITVERVESVRGVRCWHDPLVVRLVKTSVKDRVVQSAVNPVDAEIGEHEEHRELQVVP